MSPFQNWETVIYGRIDEHVLNIFLSYFKTTENNGDEGKNR